MLAIMNLAVVLTAPICRVLLPKSAWELRHWFQVKNFRFSIISFLADCITKSIHPLLVFLLPPKEP